MDIYPIELIWGGARRYLLWRGNEEPEPDRVLAIDQRLWCFEELRALERFAQKQNLPMKQERGPARYDLDSLHAWLHADGPPPSESDLLNAWNIFLDSAVSLPTLRGEFERLDQEMGLLHSKLSIRVLPHLLLKSSMPIPDWEENLPRLRQVLMAGLEMVIAGIAPPIR